MKKIYVVEEGHYSDKRILFATDDGLAAKNFVEQFNKNCEDKWSEIRFYEFEDYVPVLTDKGKCYTAICTFANNGTTLDLDTIKLQDILTDYYWQLLSKDFDCLQNNGFVIVKMNYRICVFILSDKTTDNFSDDEKKSVLSYARKLIKASGLEFEKED